MCDVVIAMAQCSSLETMLKATQDIGGKKRVAVIPKELWLWRDLDCWRKLQESTTTVGMWSPSESGP